MRSSRTSKGCSPSKTGLVAAGICLCLAHPTLAAPAPPVFRNAQHQFVFVRPAQHAPDVALAGLDGAEPRVRTWPGRLVVIAFWASWCPPCLAELSSIERFAASADPDKVQVVAVSVDSIDAAGVRALASRRGWDHLQFLRDPEQHFGSMTRLGVERGALPLYGLPTTYVLQPSGAVGGDIVGPSDWTSPQARALLTYLRR